MPPDLPRVNGSRVAMFSTSANIAPPDGKSYVQPWNGAPTREEEWFRHTFVLAMWEMVQPVPIKAILHPAKAADMRTTPYASDSPPPPIPPFLLVQNLSSKWIVPTDNMRTPNG